MNPCYEIRAKNIRGEHIRAENIRAENIREENIREENIRAENIRAKKSVLLSRANKSVLKLYVLKNPCYKSML